MKGVQFVSIKEFKTREQEGLVERAGEENILAGHWSPEKMGSDYFGWVKRETARYSADVIGGPMESPYEGNYLFGRTAQEQAVRNASTQPSA